MSHRQGDQAKPMHPHMPWRARSTEEKRSGLEDTNGGGSSSTAAAKQQLRPTSRTQQKPPSLAATAAMREASGLKSSERPNLPWDRPSPASAARSAATAAPFFPGGSVVVSTESNAMGSNLDNDNVRRSSSGGTLPPSSPSEDGSRSSTERPRSFRTREPRRARADDQKTLGVAAPEPAPAVPASKARLRGPKGRPGYASGRRASAVANPGRPSLSTMSEQGETSVSSMSSREAGRKVGVAGTAVSNRGSVVPSGGRRSEKEVVRSDRRWSRGGMEAVTRITSGELSYQIGQEIGRGGCGAVFQALNTTTGDFVAIKRMKMDNVQLDAGASIKVEIDLLKKLNHPNIVKYIDTIQTEGHLHIVLELMESSLSAMCKRFGNFSESLTAIYMTQVLEGLKYLHDQGVLHRDIKGANILTTKHGLVKLADFGVAMKLSDKQAFDVDVVGTPYWMAPEIIEMTGTNTACDLWSVGCTIIELLTGKPPYFDLPQMTALYKIVQDDHPPLPDGISQALRDFLLQCFKKQAQMRKSAVELLVHPWLKNPTNHLRKTIKVGSAELPPGEDDTQLRTVLNSARTAAQLIQTRSPQRRYDLSENDFREITSIANLDEATATATAGQRDEGGDGSPAAPPAIPRARKGTILAPAGALVAVKRRVRVGEEDWDQDWDRELGLSIPSLPEGDPSAGDNGREWRGSAQAGRLTTIAPTSEEAKHKLRALKGAEEREGNRPLLPKTLDANALDDWGDDEDDIDEGFTTSAASSVSGFGVSPAIAVPAPRGSPFLSMRGRGSGLTGIVGRAQGGVLRHQLARVGEERGVGAASPFTAGDVTELFQHSPTITHVDAVSSGARGEGVIGMEATVLRRYMEQEEQEEDNDLALGGVGFPDDFPDVRPLSLVMDDHGDEEGSGLQGGSSFADDLKARMLSHQGQAPEGEADDGFDDVFGDGFEDLTDDNDEGETGAKAEREFHAKVGQDVFRELSRLETRGSASPLLPPVTSDGLGHPVHSSPGQSAGQEVAGAAVCRVDVPVPVCEEARDASGGGERRGEYDEDEVVQVCERVCGMLDACPQARHYVMSADRGVSPLMYLVQTVKLHHHRGEEAMANVLAVINKIVDGNLKALESLAMVGLVPKVMAVLETRGAWEEEAPTASAEPRVVQIRVEAARLVRALCNGSDLTLQTLISCGGLAVLAQFLGAGSRIDGPGTVGADARRLVRIGIDGVLHVFSLQRIRRNDFCKLFLRLGLMPRIMDTFTRFLGHALAAAAEPGRVLLQKEASVTALLAPGIGSRGRKRGSLGDTGGAGFGVGGEGDLTWPYLTRAAEILTTFSKSDSVVKEGVAEDQCLTGIMGALLNICPTYVGIPKFCSLAVSLLTVLKNVSMEPSTLEALDRAGAIATLVSLLGIGKESKGYQSPQCVQVQEGGGLGDGVERLRGWGVERAREPRGGGCCDEALENQILQCMFYLCRISRKRQEKAAVAGLIPHLKRCVFELSRLKQFALQMICDLAHASGVVRGLMWDERVLEFYLSVMRSPQDRHWHVTIFRSLCAWLSSDGETDRVAGKLVEPCNLERVIFLFRTAQQVEFEDVVDKLHLMMEKSLALVKALGSSAPFVLEVMQRLHYPKAVVGKTLLSMLRQIHQHHSDPQALVRDFDLYKIVLKLSQNDSQVLVAELAGQLLQDFDNFQAKAEEDLKALLG